MGVLHYGETGDPIRIDDRVLAHLKVVISTKLRRNESFTLSWRHCEGQRGDRSTVWLHPSIPIRFEFDEPVTPELSPGRVQELLNEASATGDIEIAAADVAGT